MNWLDLVLGVMLLSATLTGYRKGFVDQLLSLVILVVALTCAKFFAPQLVRWTKNLSGVYSGQLAWGAAFVLLVAIGGVIRKMLHPKRGGDGIDGILGGAFSLVVNAFVLSIIFNFLILWSGGADSIAFMKDSKVVTAILPLSKTFISSDLLDIQKEQDALRQGEVPNKQMV